MKRRLFVSILVVAASCYMIGLYHASRYFKSQNRMTGCEDVEIIYAKGGSYGKKE